MTEQEFWKNNPHMTPQLQELYKERWKRILILNVRIEKLLKEIDEINEKRLTAMNLGLHEESDVISMEQWKLSRQTSFLMLSCKMLFVQVGASKSYKFELN